MTMSEASIAVAGECPKCGSSGPFADACPRCGLSAAKMAQWSSDVTVSDAIVAAANAATPNAPDAAHDTFINAASLSNEFAYAARHYRLAIARAKGSADQPRMTECLERVRKMSEAAALSPTPRPTPAASTPYRATMMVIVGLAFLLALGVVYKFVVMGSHGGTRQRGPLGIPSPPPLPKQR